MTKSTLNCNADETKIVNIIESKQTRIIIKYTNRKYDLKRCNSIKVFRLIVCKDERQE